MQIGTGLIVSIIIMVLLFTAAVTFFRSWRVSVCKTPAGTEMEPLGGDPDHRVDKTQKSVPHFDYFYCYDLIKINTVTQLHIPQHSLYTYTFFLLTIKVA